MKTRKAVLIGLGSAVAVLAFSLPLWTLLRARGGPAPGEDLQKQTRYLMNTYVTIHAGGAPEPTSKAIGLALDRRQEVDVKFNCLNPKSPIYAFNHAGARINDPEILRVVRTAIENGADIVTAGAGLPLNLPELTRDHRDVALVPIVSSTKALRVIMKRWERHYGRLPDAVVVEEPATAGGHLGARLEDVESPALRHETVIPEVVDFIDNKVKADVPVIAAGGIWDRSDIDHVFSLGARGVQMATRFVCTHECDAHDAFKQAYIDASEDDVVVTMSPAGLPGRVLRNSFLRAFEAGELPDSPCFADCLVHCSYQADDELFCIAAALVNAQGGKIEEGLIFCPKSTLLTVNLV